MAKPPQEHKVYTYEYDAAYDPAMPVVDIEIGRATTESSLALTALVDSGADARHTTVAEIRIRPGS